MDLNEQQLFMLNSIHNIVLQRKEMYRKAIVNLALNNEGKNPEICFAYLNFLSRKGDQLEAHVYDYGNLILIKEFLEIPEALAFIDKVSRNKSIEIAGWKDVNVKTRSIDIRNLPSARAKSRVDRTA